MIDQNTVNYIAGLARLHLEADETAKFARDLEAILQYVDQLKALDVAAVTPMSHVLNRENVFREDALKPGLSREQAFSFAIEHVNGMYKVPKVIE